MPQYIILNEDMYQSASAEAIKNGMHVEEQIHFWIRLGRACIDNPDLPSTFVGECLFSLLGSRSTDLYLFIPRNR